MSHTTSTTSTPPRLPWYRVRFLFVGGLVLLLFSLGLLLNAATMSVTVRTADGLRVASLERMHERQTRLLIAGILGALGFGMATLGSRRSA